jgi:hypothetical protein
MKQKPSLFVLSFCVACLWLAYLAFAMPEKKLAIGEVPEEKKDLVEKERAIPFTYLKGSYKGNIKGTWKYYETDTSYRGVDYRVDGNNDYPTKTYCGLSDYQKDPEQKYYILDKVKLFGGSVRMRCSYSGLGSLPSDICNIYHPIAINAHIRITFNTAYDVPKDQWDSFFLDFARHIESLVPPLERPNIKHICNQLKNRKN